MAEMNFFRIPDFSLSSNNGRKMPILGLGTVSWPMGEFESTKFAVLEAIKIGYRHFDTASMHLSEKPVGEAIAEALNLGFIKSREELFITSKLWLNDAHHDVVLPALKKSLQCFRILFTCCFVLCGNLKLEYLDLYLVHWPMSMKPGHYEFPLKKEDFLAMDFKAVWAAMEECQSLGLTKAIGVSNFSCKKIGDLLAHANIPPAVNQVEINPLWQQKKLREFCRSQGILLTAYSTLGAKGTAWGSNRVLECEKLKEIAEARGKTVAQVCLRWVHEQGDIVLVKSFNKERMKENLEIFDWSLSKEDSKKISEIPQSRTVLMEEHTTANGPFHTVEELWDGEL